MPTNPDRPVCEECEDTGVILKGVQAYEPGCGFSHDDVEERPCPSCQSPDPDHLRDLMDEDRKFYERFPDYDG